VRCFMSVAIRPEIVKLLEAQIAAGRFASVEAAIETMALDDAAAEADLDVADLAWARPYIEKGLADIEAGRTRPSADVHAEMRARYRCGS
jgi:antitoxin ParD1/3/4